MSGLPCSSAELLNCAQSFQGSACALQVDYLLWGRFNRRRLFDLGRLQRCSLQQSRCALDACSKRHSLLAADCEEEGRSQAGPTHRCVQVTPRNPVGSQGSPSVCREDAVKLALFCRWLHGQLPPAEGRAPAVDEPEPHPGLLHCRQPCRQVVGQLVWSHLAALHLNPSPETASLPSNLYCCCGPPHSGSCPQSWDSKAGRHCNRYRRTALLSRQHDARPADQCCTGAIH